MFFVVVANNTHIGLEVLFRGWAAPRELRGLFYCRVDISRSVFCVFLWHPHLVSWAKVNERWTVRRTRLDGRKSVHTRFCARNSRLCVPSQRGRTTTLNLWLSLVHSVTFWGCTRPQLRWSGARPLLATTPPPRSCWLTVVLCCGLSIIVLFVWFIYIRKRNALERNGAHACVS